MDRIKTVDVARGRWPQILRALGFPAKVLNGRPQPCVFCGGKDRARFQDYKGNGSYFCNQCGIHKGLDFVQKYKGWSFKQAADEVDKIVGTSSYVSMSPENRAMAFGVPEDTSVPRSTQQCALWLRKYHPQKLEAWLDSHSPEVRWWLETQT